MKRFGILVCGVGLAALLAAPAWAGPREDILAQFMNEGAGHGVPANGKHMYETTYGTGKPDTPRCTTCHGATPQQGGQTRTGKAIDPMAVSRTPDRFTDKAKVDKWFRRNCTSVIGRECTPQEKVDFITFMMTP